MDFEWDEQKASSNLAKHGVSFDEATAVFDDTNRLEELDASDDHEERWRAIGLAPSGVFFIVYTERDGGVIRMISARVATRHEQDRYYRQVSPYR